MLEITVPGLEYFNEETNEFTYYDDVIIELEHSLVSISKWESNWCKPFLDGKDKTMEEIIDYVKCMTVTKGIGDDVYDRLTEGNLITINDYFFHCFIFTIKEWLTPIRLPF